MTGTVVIRGRGRPAEIDRLTAELAAVRGQP